MAHRFHRITYANVMSTIAVMGIVAGGGAYASSKIGSKNVKRDAIRAKHVKDGQVRSAEIGDGHVGSADLGGAAVGSSHIEDGAVARSDIGDGQVATPELADASVTPAKLSTAARGAATVKYLAHIGYQGGQPIVRSASDAGISVSRPNQVLTVTFPSDVGSCTTMLTLNDSGINGTIRKGFSVSGGQNVVVVTQNTAGAVQDYEFDIAELC